VTGAASPQARAAFIRAHTQIAAPPLVPEVKLHLATEITPLWQATAAWLEDHDLPPPFWAFAWAGGQALARHVLDRPDWVAGKRVLDFATGSGLVGIAAAKAGAARVTAAEIDPVAAIAARMNARLNDVELAVVCDDLIGRPLPDVDVLLAGDICYERPFAERALGWFQDLCVAGTTILMGDPGRSYLPPAGLEAVAVHAVPTSRELEDRELRDTTVWRVPGRGQSDDAGTTP